MEVKIYTIPNCPFCIELKGKLDEMNIKYESIDVSLDENEEVFEQITKLSGSDSVPCVIVGKHLLAPDVNFSTIEQASKLVKHILENEPK